MIERKDIEKLAALSRLKLSDTDIEKLQGEFEHILGYVSEISRASIPEGVETTHELRNVLREDENPHESGIHTEALLSQVPQREGNHIKVKKILP